MKSSRILVIGANALTGEVIKNIVLAGVGSVSLVDDTPVSIEHVGSEFFVREVNMGESVSDILRLPYLQYG